MGGELLSLDVISTHSQATLVHSINVGAQHSAC